MNPLKPTSKPDGVYTDRKTGKKYRAQGGQLFADDGAAPAPAPAQQAAPAQESGGLMQGLRDFEQSGPGQALASAHEHYKKVAPRFAGGTPIEDMDPRDALAMPMSALQGLTLNHADEAVTAAESALKAGKGAITNMAQGRPADFSQQYEQNSQKLGPQWNSAFHQATERMPEFQAAGSMAIPGPGAVIKGAGMLPAAGRVAMGAAEGALGAHGAGGDMGAGALWGAGGQAVLGEAIPAVVRGLGPRPAAPPPARPAPVPEAPTPTGVTPSPITQPIPALKPNTSGSPVARIEGFETAGAEGTKNLRAPKISAESPYATPQAEPNKQSIVNFILQKLSGGASVGGIAAMAAGHVGAGLGLSGLGTAMQGLSKLSPQVREHVAAAIAKTASTPTKAANLVQSMNEDPEFRAQRRKDLGVE